MPSLNYQSSASESSKSQPGSEDSEEISELVEPLREEVKPAMDKLHEELKEGNSLVLHRALVCPMVLLKAVDTFGYYSK